MALPPRGQGPSKSALTPLSKGGAINKHAGKGSRQAGMQQRSSMLNKLQQPGMNTINNYAKASPMPGGTTPLAQPGGGGTPPGLGSGSFAGNGI